MRRIAAVAGLLVLLSSAPAFAASWSQPVNVSSSATFVDGPFIDFGRGGAGLAAWSWQNGVGKNARGGLRFSNRAPSGAFSPELDAPQGLGLPLVYGSDRVFWFGEEERLRRGRVLSRLKVAFGRTDGRIGAPRTVGTADTFGSPATDINDAGQIALAYIRQGGGRRRTAMLFVGRGRRLGRPRAVSGRADVNAVTTAVGPRGDIVVAWARRGRIEARLRRPGRRLGRVVTVGRGVRFGNRLRAAVTANGRAWVGWASQALSEGGNNGPFTLRTAVSAPNSSRFGRARIIDRYQQRAHDQASFDLALDRSDSGFVAWTTFDGQRFRARLASLSRTGASARFTTLSQPGYGAVVSDLATSRRPGEAIVVWSRLDDVGEVGTSVLAGYLPPGGAYAGEEQVSVGDRARSPAVAFNPGTGLPTVVWSQREGPDGPGVPLDQVRTFLRASSRTP